MRQDISYDAFKSPVEISETGVEKISFQYNASLGRAHRYYGDESVDKMQRRYRKHYSEDGGVEITEDTQSGTTSFVFYMGGDAYSAPAIWKEVHTSSAITQNMYYLHRDHLGSIVLITNNQGTAVEKRQFDAWGNIVKLTDGNGNALADFVIIDRGYTGHEHLLTVGLIHMNGRLYDPLLHRFLSPDNYVQDPTNTQNFNRYGYVLNNPLSHVDPSGEFLIPLLVAAFIGGMFNVATHLDNINNFGQGAAYFGVGAGATFAGAGVGGGVSSFLGGSSFITGAVVGAAGGFAGGFTGGFGNALVGGANFGSALGNGLISGGIGGLSGGIIGGLVGGFNAMSDGRDFWTGAGESRHEMFISSSGNSDQYSSEIEMRADYNSNIGSRDGLSLEKVEAKLNTHVNLANGNNLDGYYIDENGLLVNSNGGTAGGVTTDAYSGGFKNRILSSRIIISPGLKGYELNIRNMAFKHEFMHAWHRTFMNVSNFNTYSERAASTYSYVYKRAYPSLNWMSSYYISMVRPIPQSISWRAFSKIIPLWIK